MNLRIFKRWIRTLESTWINCQAWYVQHLKTTMFHTSCCMAAKIEWLFWRPFCIAACSSWYICIQYTSNFIEHHKAHRTICRYKLDKFSKRPSHSSWLDIVITQSNVKETTSKLCGSHTAPSFLVGHCRMPLYTFGCWRCWRSSRLARSFRSQGGAAMSEVRPVASVKSWTTQATLKSYESYAVYNSYADIICSVTRV